MQPCRRGVRGVALGGLGGGEAGPCKKKARHQREAGEVRSIEKVQTIADSWAYRDVGIGLQPGRWPIATLDGFTVAQPANFAYQQVGSWEWFGAGATTFVALCTEPTTLDTNGVVTTLRQAAPSLSEQDAIAVMLEAHNTGVGLVIVEATQVGLFGRTLTAGNLRPLVEAIHAGGALAAISRYVGDHVKVGLGYNFTDFSDDLTDLSYDHHGLFLNVVGTF